MSTFDLDAFMRDCRRSSDPTGGVWASARASVMQLFADPTNKDIELPLINVFSLPGDLPAFELPTECSPLDAPPGATKEYSEEDWIIQKVIPGGPTDQLNKYATIDEFKQQWDAATLNFLKHVDFERHSAVVAGGVVETCLQSLDGSTVNENLENGGRIDGDIDIFFVGHRNWQELIADVAEVALQVMKGMEDAGSHHENLIRRKNTLTITAYRPPGRYRNTFGRPVQLVLHREPNIAHLLARFDIDAAQYAYNGGDAVWTTLLGVRSRVFKATIVDIEQQLAGSGPLKNNYDTELSSNSRRMVKYDKRGYRVAVPMGLDSVEGALTAAGAAIAGEEVGNSSGLFRLIRDYIDNNVHPAGVARLGDYGTHGIWEWDVIAKKIEELLEEETTLLKTQTPWEPQTSALGYQAAWVDGSIALDP